MYFTVGHVTACTQGKAQFLFINTRIILFMLSYIVAKAKRDPEIYGQIQSVPRNQLLTLKNGRKLPAESFSFRKIKINRD